MIILCLLSMLLLFVTPLNAKITFYTTLMQFLISLLACSKLACSMLVTLVQQCVQYILYMFHSYIFPILLHKNSTTSTHKR